ncbi:MAG: hypothetical protein N4A57_09965 [Anaeromicrobium sp.]|jgi:hypothetical protein|uniref:hypothetical protein n=1 Tax=Anaeromicrobium sp. TaxID=1929132 RepID=UPI0025E3BEDD|nr:hypothetical protein [Anaeromicrobium sp.]MCT4594574.1 hypothetical protein [Anaeromicrobium sp.]
MDKTKSNNPKSSVHFKWGGTTSDWQAEAEELYEETKPKESPREKKHDIEYGSSKQRWSPL